MATQQFIDRGGTEAEYSIYQALYRTGRKEPRDFVFNPPGVPLSFVVSSPRVGLRIGEVTAAQRFQLASTATPRVAVISEQDALSNGSFALSRALGE